MTMRAYILFEDEKQGIARTWTVTPDDKYQKLHIDKFMHQWFEGWGPDQPVAVFVVDDVRGAILSRFREKPDAKTS
jgi:hypothetical protein